MRVALIDGDEIAYKVALQYQQQLYNVVKEDKILYHCPDKQFAIDSIGSNEDLDIVPFTKVHDLVGEQDKIDTFISRILLDTNCTEYRLYRTGKNNFRYEYATLLPYKGNREGGNKPYHLDTVYDRLLAMGCESISFLEADDMMSSNINSFNETVICSTDKDLRTVSAWNYNISTKLLQKIDEDAARYNFFKQLLLGDVVDNIPSPYMLGEVGATKILNGMLGKNDKNYYQHIIPFYIKYLTAKDKEGGYKTKWYKEQDIDKILYEIGNLLWMRRTLDPEERWSVY